MTSDLFSIESVFRPLNVWEKKFAPEALFLKGDFSFLRQGRRVSIIGSREATNEGVARARKLARLLVGLNVTVVSGLARGIDTAAHKAAIECGGKTIAVLGTPLTQTSSTENKDLQELIRQKHLLISQFPEDKPVGKGNFPIRNRLMALISDASVIIEAKDGSGTTNHGWEALRLGRPLWISKSAVEDKELKWPKEFLSYGARVLSDDTFSEFKEFVSGHEPLSAGTG